ncbi:MAG TPA: succinate dehydrogenase cytochrome b subunit [Desulfuromonadaceae bacterium]
MQLFTSSIGRKVLMAISGQSMVLFVIVHLLGNSSVFAGPGGLNSYAEHLHSMPLPIIAAFRIVMLIFVCVHIWFGIQVTIENSGGRPRQYAVKATQKATFASENMIWTGVLILAFIIYHLLQFTFRVTPDVAAFAGQVPGNVFGMVLTSFKNLFISLIYAVAMAALFLHLSHGVQSFFQTMGWNNDRTQCGITKAGTLVALILGVGFVAIPLTILLGILKG